jgi:hypothetical protein
VGFADHGCDGEREEKESGVPGRERQAMRRWLQPERLEDGECAVCVSESK